MNIFRSKKLTKFYTILSTCRLQPPHDDCAVRVQWFSSLHIVTCKQICFSCYRFIDFEQKYLVNFNKKKKTNRENLQIWKNLNNVLKSKFYVGITFITSQYFLFIPSVPPCYSGASVPPFTKWFWNQTKKPPPPPVSSLSPGFGSLDTEIPEPIPSTRCPHTPTI